MQAKIFSSSLSMVHTKSKANEKAKSIGMGRGWMREFHAKMPR
jgi:hypothetical protein